MPQIASGSNATFTVPSGYVIDVQCPGGWVQLEFPVGTKVFEGNPAGRTFGPYSGGSAKLTSVKGDIYYEVDPASSGGAPYLGQVATGCRPAFTASGSFQQLQGRSRHIAMDNITSLQLVYSGWYITNPNANAGVAEVNSPGNVTLTASIEYPVGTFTQVKFGGSASGTLLPGANLVSDAASVNIPMGAAFFVRVFQQAPSGILNIGGVSSSGFGEACNIGTTGQLTDLTMSGTITNNNPTLKFLPSAIIAQTSRPSFVLFGDSRVQGIAKDSYSDGSVLLGDYERTIGKYFGFMNLALGGERASNAAAGTCAKRIGLAQYASHVACNYGINDFTNSATAAQVQTDVTTLRALLAGKPFYHGTVSPVTTSTDGWVTTGNQTVTASNGPRVTFNTAVRQCFAGAIDGYFEVADAVETARGSGIWKAGYTTDGTHGEQVACLAVRTAQGVDEAIRMLA
jgi:hypothetical protein